MTRRGTRSSRAGVLATVAVLALLPCCGQGEAGAGGSARAGDGAEELDGAAAGAGAPAQGDPVAAIRAVLLRAAAAPAPPGSLPLEFEVEPGVASAPRCGGPQMRCIGDYLERARSGRPGPDCEERVFEQVDAARASAPRMQDQVPEAPEDLPGAVAEAIALEPLHRSLRRKPVRIRILFAIELVVGYEARLELEHPALGAFQARLLLGRDPSRMAMVALPGHPEPRGDDPIREFLDLFYGRSLHAAGHTMLVLDPRAYDSRRAEHDASVALLCGGRTLAGFRIAEGQVLLGLLRRLHATGACGPVGAIGHSGGSILGLLLYRLEPGLAFWIYDCSSDYLADSPCKDGQGRCIADETVPALYPLAKLLSEPTLGPPGPPSLAQPYAYPAGMYTAREFLDQVARQRVGMGGE